MLLPLALSVVFCTSLAAKEKAGYSGITQALPTGSNAISSDGLIAAYDFETYTSNGLLQDFSPFGNHGKLTQRTSVPGRFGKAMSFSTKDDVVILPDNPSFNLAGPITVAAKLKISTPNLHQHVFACNDLFVLWLTTSNKYRFADTLGQGVTTNDGVNVVTTEKWHSVVAVLSATKGDSLNQDNIKLYIDGAPIEARHEKIWSPSQLAPINACVIGGTRTGNQAHQDLQFEGVIDELQIFSRAFTDEEIKAFSQRKV